MSVVITEACVACGACLWECPTEAIAAGRPRPVVDAHRCVECYGIFPESQCVVVCPVHAIVVSGESAETAEKPAVLLARFERLYPGRAGVDTGYWRRTGTVPGNDQRAAGAS